MKLIKGVEMEERIKFIVGQKKRYLNQITSKMADYKLRGKNLGIFLTLEKDGHIRTPRDFEDFDLPNIDKDYSKLNKQEKKEYDKYYLVSLTYLVNCYNEANKKYNGIFENLNEDEKRNLLKEEINMLALDQKKAEIYLTTLSKQDKEKQQSKLGKKNLTKAQILEVNEEITQVKYIENELAIKTELYNELQK